MEWIDTLFVLSMSKHRFNSNSDFLRRPYSSQARPSLAISVTEATGPQVPAG
jgi:hypothetical protein